VHWINMEQKYNTRSPAVKRLMREAAEMSNPTSEYFAAPLEDNLFEWHFTVRGPEDSDFDGGIYHGRIIVPAEYPMKPPDIILLTPNGRFEVGKKICLSISGYHPETWQPSWSIRTALLAIIGFMPSPGKGSVGSLDYSKEERQVLAKRSQEWSCPICGKISLLLLPPGAGARSDQEQKEMESIIQKMDLKSEEEIKQEKQAATANQKKTEQNTEASNQEKTEQKTEASSVESESKKETNMSESVSVEQKESESKPNSSLTSRSPTVTSSRQTRASQISANNRSQQVVQEASDGGGMVYDVLIMLLVAAIATLLYRRINLMGLDGTDSTPGEQ